MAEHTAGERQTPIDGFFNNFVPRSMQIAGIALLACALVGVGERIFTDFEDFTNGHGAIDHNPTLPQTNNPTQMLKALDNKFHLMQLAEITIFSYLGIALITGGARTKAIAEGKQKVT